MVSHQAPPQLNVVPWHPQNMMEGLWDKTKAGLLREQPENHIFGTFREAGIDLGLYSQRTWVLESDLASNHCFNNLVKLLLLVYL